MKKTQGRRWKNSLKIMNGLEENHTEEKYIFNPSVLLHFKLTLIPNPVK
jgi:hypothetical protein